LKSIKWRSVDFIHKKQLKVDRVAINRCGTTITIINQTTINQQLLEVNNSQSTQMIFVKSVCFLQNWSIIAPEDFDRPSNTWFRLKSLID